MRSTTLITRIFRSGRCLRRIETAARISSVGVSPQQAMTTSGSASWSLLAHCQMPIPSVQCTTAACMVSHCGQCVFSRHHHVHIVPAAQAVIKDRQQAVGVGRQVDAHDIGLLVDDVVEEAGILVREAVVILLPDVGGEQIVERSDLPPPRQLRVTFSHLACWLNIESTMRMNAS